MADSTGFELTYEVTGHKLSAISGHNVIQVIFYANEAYTEFECRATKVGDTWGVGIGELVAAFSQTPANTKRTFEIYDTHLVRGDGEYRISLLAKNQNGDWNIKTTVLSEFEFPFESETTGNGFIFGAIQME